MRNGANHVLTLSDCHPKKFTCDSGHCIDIIKRCDNIKDCEDYSDETDCVLIRVPDSYVKMESPDTSLYANVTIVSIHRIDTLNMAMELSLNIELQWNDNRLEYANLLQKPSKTLVPLAQEEKVWNPLDNMINSAFIGKVYETKHRRRLFVKAMTPPLPYDNTHKYEERAWSGIGNSLECSAFYRIEYECIFNLRKYPFDDQECQFEMSIKLDNNKKLQFLKIGKGIKYDVPKLVKEFEVRSVTAFTRTDNDSTSFGFTVKMTRNYMSQLISIFFPSWLLWLLSYLTLFINISNFNNRFMGSITFLLVLVSLLASLNFTLPQTSYFKYIDGWFFWYVANNIAIIAYHIFIDSAKVGNRRIYPENAEDKNEGKHLVELLRSYKKEEINQTVIIIYPVLTLLFNIFYFAFTTTEI